MKKLFMRYVISENQLPARFPLAWVLVLFLWQERIDEPWSRTIFYAFIVFAFLWYMNKKFTEKHVDLRDLTELEDKELNER
jgi:hypothetical protein